MRRGVLGVLAAWAAIGMMACGVAATVESIPALLFGVVAFGAVFVLLLDAAERA